jgi:hypothetical protein
VSSVITCDPYEQIAHILPRLAINIGWLKLIGEASVEQTRRQSPRTAPLSVSAEQAAHQSRKRAARHAHRAGVRGLLAALRAAA